MERYTKFPFNCQWSIDPTVGRKLLQIQWSLKFPNSVKFSDIHNTVDFGT